MSEQPSPRTMVCTQYQTLLEASESARRSWNECRAEVCRSRLIGKETGDQLLRLQARYARAYMLLQKHANTCTRCGSVLRIA